MKNVYMVEMKVTPVLGFLNAEKIEKVRIACLEEFKRIFDMSSST